MSEDTLFLVLMGVGIGLAVFAALAALCLYAIVRANRVDDE